MPTPAVCHVRRHATPTRSVDWDAERERLPVEPAARGVYMGVVTGADAADGGPNPALFRARTTHVYVSPEVRPPTTIGAVD